MYFMKSCVFMWLTIVCNTLDTVWPLTDFKEAYYGTYATTDSQDMFDYIHSMQGVIRMKFYSDSTPTLGVGEADFVQFQMFDPQYHNGRTVLGSCNTNQNSTPHQSNMHVSFRWNGKSVTKYTCIAECRVSSESSKYSLQIKSAQQSVRCRFAFTVTELLYPNMGDKIYSEFSTLLIYSLVQIVAAYYLIKNTALDLQRLSLVALVCIWHINMALTFAHALCFFAADDSDFFFLCLLMPAFVVVDVLLPVIIIKIAKQRFYQRIPNSRLALLAGSMFLTLPLYLCLVCFWRYDTWLLVLHCSLLGFPEIVKDIRHKNRIHQYMFYYLGIVLPTSFLPIFLVMDPNNLFMIQLTSGTMTLALCIILGQTGMLICIRLLLKWKSRMRLQQLAHILQEQIFRRQNQAPQPQNMARLEQQIQPRVRQPLDVVLRQYRVGYKIDQAEQVPKCTICTRTIVFEESLGLADSITSDMLEASLLRKNESVQVIRLPCNHCFHQVCIAGWLSAKGNCPNCRAPIPGL